MIRRKMFAMLADPAKKGVAITLILGVVASIAVSGWAFLRQQDEERSIFLEMTRQHREFLKLNISSTLEAVESTRALFAASETVERDEFKRFASFELNDRPSITALEWIPRVKASERRDLERRAQSEGLVNFRITERDPEGQLIAAGERDEYFPVFYVTPEAGNEAALGFDLASNPERLAALLEARDSGKISATGRISLVQGRDESYGILVFQPVYQDGSVPETIEARREALAGFSLGVIALDTFLASSDPDGQVYAGLEFVFDESAPPGEQLLYPKSSVYQSASEIDSGKCDNTGLQIAGRTWAVVHCPRTKPVEAGLAIFALVILLAGTGAAAWLVYSHFQRQHAEETFETALQASEARFQNVLNHTPIMMQSVDAETGNIISCNNGWLQRMGYKPEEIRGLGWQATIHPDEIENCEKKLKKAAASGEPLELATRFVTKSGDTVYVRGSIIILPEENGIMVTTGIFIDVTERAKAEEVLRESEAKFSGILDIAGDAIISIDEKNKIILFNKGAEAIFGYSQEEAMGKSIEALMPERFHSGHHVHIEEFRGSDKVARQMKNGRDVMALRANGEEFPAQATISKLATGGGLVSTIILRDITEEQAITAENLRIANELTTLIDTANAPIFGVDKDGVMNEWNQKAAEITGLTRAEVLGRNAMAENSKIGNREAVQEVIRRALGGRNTENFEFWIPAKNGGRAIILLNATPRRDSEGNIIGVIGVGQDITARKAAEEELRKSNEHIRLLLDSTAEAIYGIDTEGNCTFVNAACVEMLGYKNQSFLLGRNMHYLMHHTRADGTPYPNEECEIYTAFRRGEGSHVSDEVLWRLDGSSFPAEYWSHPIVREGEIVGAVVTFLDITEKKLAEAEVIQSSKLSTLGEMATGMAHELNQPLNVIKMAADNALDSLESGENDSKYVAEKLGRISSQIDRAAEIIDHMRVFGRKAEGKPRLFDPAEATRRALEFCQAQLRLGGVDVQLDFPGQPFFVMGQDIQFEQVVLNLVTNARQAMEGAPPPKDNGHVLRISIHQEAGGEAIVSVSDTGGGVPEDVLDRIFEPFFTTKDVGSGTGLGLSISYGIIRELGGKISAHNAGGGAVFTIRVPTVPEAAPTSEPSPSPGADA